ncbi:hypothetical protein [Pelagibacterium montanilacus]|uniref:hypothetical protein n=1 Tax=Pelagibacterium montanilacus TaxID=2185280 RepID=UPI000F8D81EB|nr:hypothetical protein [Pelagibacterium montanilacus]
MMIFRFLLLPPLVAFSLPALAEDSQLVFGGDHYAAGQTTTVRKPVEGDAFVAGYHATLSAPVTGSAHLAGFNASSENDIGQNLYALGFAVDVNGPVEGNVSATGNTVDIARAATIGGNARLSGASVKLEAPVQGSAVVAADVFSLSSEIGGDFSFYGRALNFEPGARVTGALHIHAPEPIEVPASVADASRVTFSALEDTDYVAEAGRTAESVARGYWPALWGVAIVLLLLILSGAMLIAFAPGRLETIHTTAETRPFRSLGWGALTFAMLLGLVPLSALTVIGIVALPLIFFFIAALLGLAYVMGAYLIGTRVARAFLTIDTNAKRLGVMTGSIIIAVLLAVLPIIGWFLILLIVTLGLGSTARTIVVPRNSHAAPTSFADPVGGPRTAS